jgi:LacI family transcriptional regulator
VSQKHPTMIDIAQAAGVSQSTVSIVLSGKKGASIPSATVERILKAARELNYSSRPRTQHPSAPSSDSILALTGSMTNSYYAYIVQALEAAALPSKLRIVACNTYHNPENEEAFLDLAIQHGFLAAIYLYPPENPAAAGKANLHFPVIAICDKGVDTSVDLIELNNFQAGCIAAEHLISLGHRQIAVMSRVSNKHPGKNLPRVSRIKGITHQMEQHGLSQSLSIFEQKAPEESGLPGTSDDYKLGFSMVKNSDITSGKYTAFIATSDMLALGVMDALTTLGFQVPGDFSIVGFDNLQLTEMSRISLTTVDNHPGLLAQAAIDLLLHRMNPSVSNPLLSSARFKVECTPHLVIRSSTAPPKHAE